VGRARGERGFLLWAPEAAASAQKRYPAGARPCSGLRRV